MSTSPNPQAGTLDDDTFATTTRPAGYTIIEIGKNGGVLFRTYPALADADRQHLTLHVCGQDYLLGDFSGNNPYRLSSSQDWASHGGLTFYISEDLVDPTFVDATVDGTSLVMTFSEKLRQADHVNVSSTRFTVTKGPSDTAVGVVSALSTISDNTVTITLSSAITASDTNIKVSYTRPSTVRFRVLDLAGRSAANFSAQPVFNILADSTAPTLAQANPAVLGADGTTLTLTMNETMRTTNLPDASAFTVKATPHGGSETPVSVDATTPVEASGSTVTLKLATPIANNDTNVKVSYVAPSSGGKLQDRSHNDLASFTDQTVTNNSAIPRVSLEATYNDASPGIAHAEFRATRSNTDPSNALRVNLEFTQTQPYLSSPHRDDHHPRQPDHRHREVPQLLSGQHQRQPGRANRGRRRLPARGQFLQLGNRGHESSHVGQNPHPRAGPGRLHGHGGRHRDPGGERNHRFRSCTNRERASSSGLTTYQTRHIPSRGLPVNGRRESHSANGLDGERRELRRQRPQSSYITFDDIDYEDPEAVLCRIRPKFVCKRLLLSRLPAGHRR